MAESPWKKSAVQSFIADASALLPDGRAVADIGSITTEELERRAKLKPYIWSRLDQKIVKKMLVVDKEIEAILSILTPVQRATYFAEKLGQEIAAGTEAFDQAVAASAVFAAHTLNTVNAFNREHIKGKLLDLMRKSRKP